MTFDELEQIRQAYADKYHKIIKTFVAIILPILGVLFLLSWINPVIFFFVPFISITSFILAFIIVAIATRHESAAYKSAYKAYFVAKSLAKTFTNIVYSHDAALSPDIYGLVMPKGDRRSSNDLVTATYKNIGFTQADVHTEDEYTDSDGDTSYVTVFYGRFLIFDFNRDFISNLILKGRRFPGATVLTKTSNSHKFEKIKVEFPELNSRFRIYAQDSVDAFYILDPSFIEKLVHLSDQYKNSLLFAFMDHKLYIALNDHKDAFEPANFKKPINEQSELAKVNNDIKVITDLVDSLNLDKYFKKAKS